MKIADDQPSGLTALDRPNSYIGRSVPRPNLARLTQGRGQYVSDVVLPRMAHVAFVRSPHAHARIKNIATAEAKKAPGVIAVFTGADCVAGGMKPIPHIPWSPHQAEAVLRMKNGEAPFTHPIDLRMVAPMNAGPLFFIVRAQSPIKSVSDLRGRKVAVGMRTVARTNGIRITMRASFVTSAALEYSPAASRPSGRTKWLSFRPSCAAFAFIIAANAG